MYHDIITHLDYIQTQLSGPLSAAEKAALYRYHVDRVHDFQHERLIHLLVTFFFGFLFIGAVTALLVQPLPELRPPLFILCGILFVLELAYVRHYYQLENGVQSLYPLTVQLHETCG